MAFTSADALSVPNIDESNVKIWCAFQLVRPGARTVAVGRAASVWRAGQELPHVKVCHSVICAANELTCRLSVILSPRGSPMWPLPMMHWTSLYSTLWTYGIWTPSLPWPYPQASDTGIPQTCPLLVTSGEHHWRHVQTCSLEDPLTPKVIFGGGPWRICS